MTFSRLYIHTWNCRNRLTQLSQWESVLCWLCLRSFWGLERLWPVGSRQLQIHHKGARCWWINGYQQSELCLDDSRDRQVREMFFFFFWLALGGVSWQSKLYSSGWAAKDTEKITVTDNVVAWGTGSCIWTLKCWLQNVSSWISYAYLWVYTVLMNDHGHIYLNK